MKLAAAFALVLLALPAAPGAAAAEPTVRVGVLGLMRPVEITARPAGPCRISPEVARAAARTREGIPGALVLTFDPSGVRFHALRGLPAGPVPDVVFDPGEGAVELSLDNGFRRVFRGRVRIFPSTAGPYLQAVAERTLSGYLAGVIRAETRGAAPPDALRSLAVTAASYVRCRRSPHGSEGFDFCDSTHCMYYAGEEKLPQNVREAAEFGTRFTLDPGTGESPVFSSCCGGECLPPAWVWTEAGPGEEGKPVACPWCRGSADAAWHVEIPFERFRKMVETVFGIEGLAAVTAAFETPGGNRVVLEGKERKLTLPAEKFRIEIGRRYGWNLFRSTRFTVKRRGGLLRFDGRGFGHGAGLCVAGAAAMARKGFDWKAILGFYFPRSTVRGIPGGPR